MKRREEEIEQEEMEGGELNLVPYLDIVTNVMLFLLATVTSGLILGNITPRTTNGPRAKANLGYVPASAAKWAGMDSHQNSLSGCLRMSRCPPHRTSLPLVSRVHRSGRLTGQHQWISFTPQSTTAAMTNRSGFPGQCSSEPALRKAEQVVVNAPITPQQ